VLGLLLYYRFHWLIRSDRVRVTMHNLPGAIFTPKNGCGSQSYRGEILAAANLGPGPLYLDDEAKVRSDHLHYVLKSNGLAFPVVRRSALHGLNKLLPSTHRRTPGVSHACLFSLSPYH